MAIPRTILFRGKKKDGEWLVGDLNQMDGGVYIFDRRRGEDNPDFFEVLPNTIGQFTGIEDAEGKRIFEGDIVSLSNPHIGIIEWRSSGFYITGSDYALNTIWFKGGSPRIVGNIHDGQVMGSPESKDSPKSNKCSCGGHLLSVFELEKTYSCVECRKVVTKR